MSDADLKEKELEANSAKSSPETGGEEQAALGNDSASNKIPFHKEASNKARSWFSKRSSKLLLFGGGGAGVLTIVAILVFLASLAIPNLATHVAEYTMLRTVRTFRQSSERVFSEKISADVTADASDGLLASIKNKYGGLRSETWGKLDRFRPQKVVDNLEGAKKIQFVYEEADRTILPGKKLNLKAILIDGERVDLPQLKTARFYSNTVKRVEFGAQIDSALADAVPEVGNIVRGQATKKILNDLGFRLVWWEKKGLGYKGLTEEEAFKKQQQEAAASIGEKSTASSSVPDIEKQAEESKAEVTKEVADGSADELDLAKARAQEEAQLNGAAKGVAETTGLADAAIDSTFAKTLRNAFKDSLAESVVKSASSVYQIALPVCIIYDGSITKAGPSIDDKTAAAEKSFFALQTAADQQKAGDTTGEAIGAFRNKLGTIATTIPERRAAGEVIDSNALARGPDNPQSGTFGDVTVVEALAGGSTLFTKTANSILGYGCPKLLSPGGIGVGILAELGLAFLTGGESEVEIKAGEKLAATAVEEVIKTEIQRSLIQRIKTGAFGMLRKAGRDLIVLGTLTMASKALTVQYAGAHYDGLSTNGDFAMEADIGGNLYAGDVQRQGMYGAPMVAADVDKSKLADAAFQKQQIELQSPYARYFALNNPDSLLAKTGYAAMAHAGSFNQAVKWMGSSLLGGIGKIFSLSSFSGLLSAKATAYSGAANFKGDYNIIQWGWTEDELALIRDNPDYGILANAEEVASKPDLYGRVEKDYGDCFTKTMGDLISKRDIKRDKDGAVNPTFGKCSPQNLSINSPGYGDAVFRWRLSKLNEATIDHLLGVQAPTPAGGQSAANSNVVVAGDTSNLTCAAGSDAGVGDGYKSGQLFKIRLCNVQGVIINAQIAENVDKMFNAAHKDGELLAGGGGFRTNDQQQALRVLHGCPDSNASSDSCNPPTARPGYSNHQMGLAIDFVNCSAHSTSCWQWLNVHAKDYGLQNFDKEPWHWSVDGR